MKRLTWKVFAVLIAFTMLFTTQLSAKASTPAVKILEGDITEKETGLTYEATAIINYGPDDFAVIGDNDIVILDSLSCRLQRYCDGVYFETIQLPNGQKYLRMYASEKMLYVVSRSSLYIINLDTKEQTEVALPYETKDEDQNIFGSYVNDILEADGRLILVTEVYGNYALNKGEKSFEKVPSDYCAFREGGLGGKTICVKMGNQHWDIAADNLCGYPIGMNADGDLFVYLQDMNPSVGETNYCRILRYSPDGTMTAVSTVDMSKWVHTPRAFAHMAEDGKVYILGIYADKFIVYKLEVGKEDIREPERPVPKINMGPIEQETAHEGEGGVKAAPNVSKSRSQVQTRALGMIYLTWTFANGNDRWNEYGATAPHQLENEEFNTTQMGIPYCWGKMNGYETVSGGTAFSSIITTMDQNNNKRLYAAGNLTSPKNNNTVGVDCASFVASAYGYSSLATTKDFAESSNFTTISQSDLMRMDIIVKSDWHMMLFKQVSSTCTTHMVVYECLGGGSDNRTIVNESRTFSSLDSEYIYRTPNNWINCSHPSVSSVYLYDNMHHWKRCLFCEGPANVVNHSFVLQSDSSYKCSVCGYRTYSPVVTSVLPDDQ